MTEPIRLRGVFETHLRVSDLERSARFYERTLDLKEAFRDEARRVRFYWVGRRGEAMLGLWETEASQMFRQHFAFRSTPDELPGIVRALKERGVRTYDFHNESEEPFVFPWMPAAAIYFDDPDGHTLECLAMLPDDPESGLGIVSWDAWSARTRSRT